jgi:hypothetical protein
MGTLSDYFSGKTTAEKVKMAEMIAQANALRADKTEPKPKEAGPKVDVDPKYAAARKAKIKAQREEDERAIAAM